jgi:hypothetical protein
MPYLECLVLRQLPLEQTPRVEDAIYDLAHGADAGSEVPRTHWLHDLLQLPLIEVYSV